MKIDFLNPQGPQPTELVGLAEFRRKLPSAWRGYANFNVRNTRQRGQDREVDVVLIVPDRLILIDLKHTRGRIESRSGRWYQGNEDIGKSAATKIRENAKVFSDLIRKQVPKIPGAPPVECAVVFTHHDADLSGLDSNEKDRCFKLADFMRIANPTEFAKIFTARSNFGGSGTLNSGHYFSALEKLFTNGSFIEPRKAKYHGFVPIGDPEFKHPLFEEYACNDEADPNYSGLLRVWDFSTDPDSFSLEETRRPVAERERSLLGYVRMQNPNFYDNYVLRSIAHDREYTRINSWKASLRTANGRQILLRMCRPNSLRFRSVNIQFLYSGALDAGENWGSPVLVTYKAGGIRSISASKITFLSLNLSRHFSKVLGSVA